MVVDDPNTDRKKPVVTKTMCPWCAKDKMVYMEEHQTINKETNRVSIYKWLTCPSCFYSIDLGVFIKA